MKNLETLFRIYDVKRQEYYSTGKKSIWKSERWALSAIEDKCKNSNFKPQDFEIHVTEQTIISRLYPDVLLMNKKERLQKTKEAEYEIKRLKEEVSHCVGNLPYDTVYKLFHSHMLASDVMEELEPRLKEIAEYNRFLKNN